MMGRRLAITWLFVSAAWACSGNEDSGHSGSETGGAAGKNAAPGGSSGAAGRASSGGDSVEGGANTGGSQSGGTSGSGGSSKAGAGGSESAFWCDLSDTNVCKCRLGPKPNAAATTSCPQSDCCVRTGAGDNRSCACRKPDSAFTCEDVKNYVGGAIVIASCPF